MTDYPSNITDNQWNSIEKFFDPAKRKRKHPLIEIMNAILYSLVSGCQWRMLPKDFPPYNTVYCYFRKWKNESGFEQALFELHKTVRVAAGREECPSLGIIDSKSVRNSNHVDSNRGIDGNKRSRDAKYTSASMSLVFLWLLLYMRLIFMTVVALNSSLMK